MLTTLGRSFFVAQLAESLRDAQLFISDGADQRAEAPLDEGFPVESEETPGVLIFQATFGEDEANFDWYRRGIVLGPGGPDSEIDADEGDDGRKAPGSIWTLRVLLNVQPTQPDA